MRTEHGALALVTNIHGKLEFLRTVAFLEIVFSFMGVDLPFFTAADLKSNSVMGLLGILPLQVSACDRGMNRQLFTHRKQHCCV